MKSAVLSAIILTGFASNSFALTGLEGKWTLRGMECKSGAKANPNFPGSRTKMEVEATITETEINAAIHVDVQYEKSYVDKTKAEFAKSRALVKSLPESADTRKTLAEIDKQEKLLAPYEKFNCYHRSVMKYSVQNNILTTEILKEASDCPGWTPSTKKTSASLYELKGDALRMVSSDSEQNENSGTCPKGDYSVTVMSRVK